MAAFVIVDYFVFGLAVVVSLGIGVYYAISGQKTTSEYLVGGRQMKVLPVAISLMVSFESSIMMLGFPAETYKYGMMFWLSNFGFLTSCLLATRMVVPLIHPLKITSVYEYYELRYNSRGVRLMGMIFGTINYVFYMGIVLFGPGIALESVTSFPMWASTLLVALASVIYTSIGGIKAVIWTDVFQSLIMFMGIFAILIKGTMVAGGVSRVIDINVQTGRLDIFDFNTDPTVRHTFWNLVVGGGLRMISLNIGQTTIQRIASTPRQKDANTVLYFAGPAFFVTLTLATMEGLVAYAYYYTLRCDPLEAKQIKNPNQIIPFMVIGIFSSLPGMPGLFMASLFSASLSTLSSGLSSLSALTVEDIIKPTFRSLSETKTTLLAKLSVITYGALCVAVSYIIAKIKGPMSQITSSVLSAFGGPTTGLFLFSVFIPWGTPRGAMIGTVLAVIFGFWVSVGQNFSTSLRRTPGLPPGPIDRCQPSFLSNTSHFNESSINMTTLDYTLMDSTTHLMDVPLEPQGLDKLYSISYQWLSGLGILVTLFLCTVVSLIDGRPDPTTIDVRYMLPFFDQFFPFLPWKIRKFLYCRVPFEKREELLKQMRKGGYEQEYVIVSDKEELSNLERDHEHESGNEMKEMSNVNGETSNIKFAKRKNEDAIATDDVVLVDISKSKNNESDNTTV